MITLGLDGCKGGWVVVGLSTTGAPTITAVPSIDKLTALDFDLAAIDIPIGLPAHGVRTCDQLARDALAENRTRVFTGVRRDLLDVGQFNASGYSAANRRLKAAGQPGIAVQLWNIFPKIKEVDSAIRADPSLCGRLREVHPELVFWRLNGHRSVLKKKSIGGLSKRIELLHNAGLTDTDAWISRSERRRLSDLLGRPRMSVQPDDVLDACAAAVAARDSVEYVPPGDAVTDDCDLPMRIWF